jgi:3-oxoacyl-[acyl-carrier-protein] synthase-3
MVISCSISKYRGRFNQQLEPPLSMYVKNAIGAPHALSFDVSNACAGMLTGVFLLNDFIRRGEIRRGMVVSGECISQLGSNASKQVRNVLSRQLASLTLGDAGAAFTTLSEHSRLCLAYPSHVGPGATMYTRSRAIHKVAIEDGLPLVEEALREAGVELADVDWFIPHQTSARAIRKGVQQFERLFGAAARHTVVNVEEYGNTSSTTHFVALYRYLQERRFRPGDRVLLMALASGLEIGLVYFPMDELVSSYGSSDPGSSGGDALHLAGQSRGAPAR